MDDAEKDHERGSKKQPPLEANITLITPEKNPSKTSIFDLKTFEAFVALVKALAWPLLILYLFAVLRVPLTKTIELLPQKFSESTKFSVGSLSFEIQQSAEARGNPELGKLIGGLSPKAVETLLKIGKTTTSLVSYSPDSQTYYLLDDQEMDALSELDNKNIVEFIGMPFDEFRRFLENLHLKKQENRLGFNPTRRLTVQEEDALKKQNYRLTEEGQKAFDLIIQVVSQQLENPPSRDERGK